MFIYTISIDYNNIINRYNYLAILAAYSLLIFECEDKNITIDYNTYIAPIT